MVSFLGPESVQRCCVDFPTRFRGYPDNLGSEIKNGFPLIPDSDGSVVLRPGNKYEYTFGFELPQNG